MRRLMWPMLVFVAVLGGCAQISPEGKRLLFHAAASYERGEDAAVIDSTSKFLELHPRLQESGEAHYMRGLSYCRTGKTAAGRRELGEALELTRRKDVQGLVHFKLGNLAYAAANHLEAADQYRKVLEVVPAGTSPADEAMYRLGVIYQQQGRWREADEYFDRVIHLFQGREVARLAAQRVRATCWSIQVAACATAAAADDMLAQLRKARVTGRVDLELRAGRMMRLVRVGSYPTYPAAGADAPKLRKAGFEAIIVPARR